MRAKKLDCEYEKRSPTQIGAISTAADCAALRSAPKSTATTQTRIATTRKRPYTDGSQKSEFTRKNGWYTFPTETFGFQKILRLSYW